MLLPGQIFWDVKPFRSASNSPRLEVSPSLHLECKEVAEDDTTTILLPFGSKASHLKRLLTLVYSIIQANPSSNRNPEFGIAPPARSSSMYWINGSQITLVSQHIIISYTIHRTKYQTTRCITSSSSSHATVPSGFVSTTLYVRGSVHRSIVHIKIQQDATVYQNIISYLYEAQHDGATHRPLSGA